MNKIFYKPSKFAKTGEKFAINSGLGGAFTIEFVELTKDGIFKFVRKAFNGWPKQEYQFTAEQVSKSVYIIVPDKYERLVMNPERQNEIETLEKDIHIDRIERA